MAGRRTSNGNVAAIAVLPDGRPVEFGTFEMGAPRCYLRLRDKKGEPVEFVPVLAGAHCRAIDLKIDRDTGDDARAARAPERRRPGVVGRESSAWGKGPKNIGIGVVGDTALALAAGPMSSRSAARGRWRRKTSSTRSPCCCARTSPRRRGCSTAS
jgi:hypothetical protein